MADRHVIETAAVQLAERAVAAARTLTRDGHALDDHQVVVERVAYAATEARVIAELAAAPDAVAEIARIAIAELAAAIPHRLAPVAPALGHALGNLAMILTTEELSRASLAAAGSLITRPEILAKALLAGGTEAQKQAWLPRLAGGEIMCAISVTEPNVGSDVASVACKAERAPGGWAI